MKKQISLSPDQSARYGAGHLTKRTKTMKKQISLSPAIQGEYELTEDDKQQIYTLLTHRCRRKTKDDIMGRLNYIMCQPASALFERVIKEEFSDGSTKWVMIAGQDYTEQMKDTRNLLLGR